MGELSIMYEALDVRVNDGGEAGGPPLRFDGDLSGCVVPIAGSGPHSGLPPTMKGYVGLTYEMDLQARELRVSRFTIDFPGFIKIEMSFVLVGVGPGDPEPERDPSGVGIQSFKLVVDDRGFLRRAESTVAWKRGVTSNGMLREVAPAGSSPAARAIRTWLRSADPGSLEIWLSPECAVTIGDVQRSMEAGLDVDKQFELSASFAPHARGSLHC